MRRPRDVHVAVNRGVGSEVTKNEPFTRTQNNKRASKCCRKCVFFSHSVFCAVLRHCVHSQEFLHSCGGPDFHTVPPLAPVTFGAACAQLTLLARASRAHTQHLCALIAGAYMSRAATERPNHTARLDAQIAIRRDLNATARRTHSCRPRLLLRHTSPRPPSSLHPIRRGTVLLVLLVKRFPRACCVCLHPGCSRRARRPDSAGGGRRIKRPAGIMARRAAPHAALDVALPQPRSFFAAPAEPQMSGARSGSAHNGSAHSDSAHSGSAGRDAERLVP